MPCSYDDGGASVRKMREDLDKLTVEADRLRELVISLVTGTLDASEVPADIYKEIERRQVAHRKEDLKRLERTFIAKKDTERLALVWKANPKKPLTEQLGFDPDDF